MAVLMDFGDSDKLTDYLNVDVNGFGWQQPKIIMYKDYREGENYRKSVWTRSWDLDLGL